MNTPQTVNFATNLRWVTNVPFTTLFPDENDIHLNLTQFDIPDIEIGATDASYLGYEIEVPTGLIQAGEKTATFTYIIDAEMYTYWLMYKWAGMYTKYIVPTVKDAEEDSPPVSDRIPISVIILDEYKKPILNVTYHNCWIKSFANLSMSYQDEPAPLQHSFTIAYTNFTIERVTTA